MENAFAKAEELVSNLKAYFDSRIESIKLGAAEKISVVIANLVAGIILLFVFFLFIIFAGIAFSFLLGNWIGSTWAGFLIVSGLYLVLGIIVWAGRGKFLRLPLMNAMIKQLFNQDDEED